MPYSDSEFESRLRDFRPSGAPPAAFDRRLNQMAPAARDGRLPDARPPAEPRFVMGVASLMSVAAILAIVLLMRGRDATAPADAGAAEPGVFLKPGDAEAAKAASADEHVIRVPINGEMHEFRDVEELQRYLREKFEAETAAAREAVSAAAQVGGEEPVATAHDTSSRSVSVSAGNDGYSATIDGETFRFDSQEALNGFLRERGLNDSIHVNADDDAEVEVSARMAEMLEEMRRRLREQGFDDSALDGLGKPVPGGAMHRTSSSQSVSVSAGPEGFVAVVNGERFEFETAEELNAFLKERGIQGSVAAESSSK